MGLLKPWLDDGGAFNLMVDEGVGGAPTVSDGRQLRLHIHDLVLGSWAAV